MFLPGGEWLPDQPDFSNPGASTITNVYPRTDGSYGPVGGLSTILNALTARCQGAAGFRDSTGSGYVFSGDSTKLYKASVSSSTWADVSGATYSIASDQFWSFVQFGDRIIAFSIADAIQSYVIGSSSAFADLSAAAPKARYGAVVRDFFVVGNTSDGTYGVKPQRVWWSAIDDPTSWPTPGTSAAAAVQSDFQDVVGEHGWLQGIVPNVGATDALILFERGVYRMMYIGAPDIFGFYPMHGARGCSAPGSIANTEYGVIYLGPDDFYLNNGQDVVPLGFQKVAKTFYSDLNQNFINRIICTVDPINKIYALAYPSNNSSTGICDKILFCNYALKSVTGTPGKWSNVSGLSIEYLLKATSFGYNTDTVGSATGYNTDTAPFPVDSRVWTGGAKEILSAFNSAHTMAFFNGTNLAASVQTSETQIIKGRRALVSMTRPIVDGGSPTVTPITRNRLIDSVSTGSSSSLNSAGYCPVLADAFYHRFQIDIPAGSNFSHIQGVEVPDDSISDGGAQ